VRFLLAIAITWIAVHLSNPARAQVRYLESADVQPADPACVRDAVRALLVSNFHADIVSANTVCRRDATVVVHEGSSSRRVGSRSSSREQRQPPRLQRCEQLLRRPRLPRWLLRA